MYDVDGFLYYLVNDWVNYTTADSETGHWGWNAKHEVENNSTTPYDVYGNGVLLYHGFPDRTKGTGWFVPSECVRDGIEDFEYFTMLATNNTERERLRLLLSRSPRSENIPQMKSCLRCFARLWAI